MKFPLVTAIQGALRARFAKMLTVVSSGGGWFSLIREPFGGAWQSDVHIDGDREVLSFSAVFACVTSIANDISKMGVKKMVYDEELRVSLEDVAGRPAVFRRPNRYQHWRNFMEQWLISKLLHGNVYVLLVPGRAGRGVESMHVLDPKRVTVLVTESGDVYYKLARDDLSGLKEEVTLPARFILHDRMNCLWHPLVGVSSIYACGLSATMGRQIQKNSTKFFKNMSRPSGALTAPGVINDETAERMKRDWEANFGGDNIGRLAVLGDGLKYEPMTIPAQDAQLIEQLKWTVEDVARSFHFPMYKLGGAVPSGTSISALNQGYYSDCLQPLIEDAELCLDFAFGLKEDECFEFDLDALLRMDAATRFEAKGRGVKDGWVAPNEVRRGENLPPVLGGETPYLQQQNFSLAALAKRDALDNPFSSTPRTEPPPASEYAARAEVEEFAEHFIASLAAEAPSPAQPPLLTGASL